MHILNSSLYLVYFAVWFVKCATYIVTEIKEKNQVNKSKRSQNNFIPKEHLQKKKSNYAEEIEQNRDNPIDREQREKGGVMVK